MLNESHEHESKSRFRSIFEDAAIPMAVQDPDGYYLRVNQALCELLGRSEEELIGLSYRDITHEEHLEQDKALDGQMLDGLIRFYKGQEKRYRHKDGHAIWVLVSASLVRDPDGEPLYRVVQAQDISAHKRAEESIRRERDFSEAILDSLPGVFYLYDEERRFMRWNKNFTQVTGYSDAEMVERSPLDFFEGADKESVARRIEEVFRQGAASVEADFVAKDGRRTPYYFTGLRVLLDGKVCLLGVGIDISERKQAEEAIKERETRFRATFEQAAVGIAHVRPDGRWLRVNQKLCDIVGYAREELLELTFQDITHADDLDADLENVRQILAGEIETYSMEKRYLRKDGSIIWIDLTISLVREPSGEPDYFIAVIQDITEAKRMEEQYYQAQKMEAVGQLTAGVAHDFNNLLTAINGFAELMKLELPPGATQQESLDRILHSGRRATDLVRQLLAFSRKQIIQPQVLNLNTSVASMCKLLKRIIGEDITLTTSLAPELWWVKADPTQLEQVIVNLAVNARDAMPEGGQLTLETANARLDDDYVAHHLEAQAGEHVLLAISDTGWGMSPEVKAHIFEPFFTTKEQGKGTGLGLAMVYGIVTQNGGHIWVDSEPGAGTTFKIYLPRTEEEQASSTPREVEAETPAGNETILLVEDDVGVRKLTRQALHSQGYTVLEAEEGEKALQLAAEYRGPIHLLLTDVIMPGMSGKLLAEKLAQARAGLKVLFMSGYSDNAIAQHGVLDPGVFLLQKPFGPEALAHKVRSVLDGS